MASQEASVAAVANDNDESNTPKERKHNTGTVADLEKITDYVEDKEVCSQEMANAISLIGGNQAKEKEEREEKERRLAQVKVKKEDVDLIVKEMEVAKSIAERKLKEHDGDVVAALVELSK